MVAMSVASRTLCCTLKGYRVRIFTFSQIETRTKRVSMTMTLWVLFGIFCDEHFWCHIWRTLIVYFQKYSLFSILPFKLQTSRLHHFLNLHNTKTSISLNWKKYSKKENTILIFWWKVFPISNNYFSFHRHFKIRIVIEMSNEQLPAYYY